MESEPCHSLQSPSDSIAPRTTTSRKRAREGDIQKPPRVPRAKSPYWEHCEKGTRKSINGITQQIGICNYCKIEIPTGSGSTSGLNKCVLSPLYEVNKSEKGQSTLTTDTMMQGSRMVSHTFN